MSSHFLPLVPRNGLAQTFAANLVPALFSRAVEAPIAWLDRARDRRQLAALDDASLKDIGVSRADAEHEVSKRFWEA